MLFSEIQFGTPAFDEALSLRNRILRIPLGRTFEIDDIKKEYEEVHFGLYRSDLSLLACLTFRKLSLDRLKMRQVAVEESAQGAGVGRHLINESEKWAVKQGYHQIECSARVGAIDFYKKCNYTVVSEMFLEVGIEHFRMQKELFYINS